MILDVGSGPHPRLDADIHMDIHPCYHVEVIHDMSKPPYPFIDAAFDKIYLGDVIEHISVFDVNNVLNEIHRILKPQAILEITTPDFRWICERIVNGDWKEKTQAAWLNKGSTDWDNAMSYIFGGFHNIGEYQMKGMGHINGFDHNSLVALLEKNSFTNCQRIPDNRNLTPAKDSILKITCNRKD